MTVTLDLTRLLHDGLISQSEHDRLAAYGERDTGQRLVNVLVGFGVIAVSLGALALAPASITGLLLGSGLMAAGVGLAMAGPPRWRMLADICILLAALMLGGGIVLLSQGVGHVGDAAGAPLAPLWAAELAVALLFAGCAALARSGLLASLTVLMLFAALGGSSDYEAATYGLQVTRPAATVLLFAVLAAATYWGTRGLTPDWARLGVVAARTALFLVNLGFWIGSLWGDDLEQSGNTVPAISAVSFAVLWAACLVGAGIWAGRSNRRWLLNLVAVFGGIHFYTQWFERLGATPVSLLGAGLVLLVSAILLWRLNHRDRGSAAPGDRQADRRHDAGLSTTPGGPADPSW